MSVALVITMIKEKTLIVIDKVFLPQNEFENNVENGYYFIYAAIC